ncbi:MAG: hypothetical protein NXI20_18645 [bacterium]|nr:hypothetical protein [bacterium]
MTALKNQTAATTTQSADEAAELAAEINNYLKSSYKNKVRANLSEDVTGIYQELPESELLILESDEGKFLGSLHLDKPLYHSTSEEIGGVLTTVGTVSKAFHLFFHLFIDHQQVIEEAKQEAAMSFLKTSVLVEERFCSVKFTHVTPENTPSPMIIQKFKKFLGIPYKVTYHVVAWKSENIKCSN